MCNIIDFITLLFCHPKWSSKISNISLLHKRKNASMTFNHLSTFFFAGNVKFTKNGKQQFSCARCVVGSIPTNSLCIECFSIKRSENISYGMLRWTDLLMVCKQLSHAVRYFVNHVNHLGKLTQKRWKWLRDAYLSAIQLQYCVLLLLQSFKTTTFSLALLKVERCVHGIWLMENVKRMRNCLKCTLAYR